MEIKGTADDKEAKRLNDLRNSLILHYHQDANFYERRTYIAFFVISGIGLYSCLDLYKNLKYLDHLILLTIATSLFVMTLALSIVSNELARSKSLNKADYFQTLSEKDRKRPRKYIKWENGLKLSIGCLDIIGCVLIGFLYFSNFQ